MDVREIHRGYEHDLVNRVTAGARFAGATVDANTSIFGMIDISKHNKLNIAFANTDGANAFDYAVQVTENPLDTTPVWVELDSGSLATGETKVVEKPAVGTAMQILLKSKVASTPATFEVFYRLIPH